MVRNENLNVSPTDIELSPTVTLLRTHGVHRLRCANDDRAIVVLVVRGERLEVWLSLDACVSQRIAGARTQGQR